METTSSFICPQPSLISKSCCTSCTGWFFTWMSQHGHKAQLQLSVLQNQDGLSLKQPHLVTKPVLEKLFKGLSFLHSPHSILSAYTTYSSTTSPEQTAAELTWPLHWGSATAPSTWLLLATHQKPSSEDSHEGFFFLLWIHLILIRLCHIFMPLPAVFSHWDFA